MSQKPSIASQPRLESSSAEWQKLQIKIKNLIALCVKKQHALEVQYEIAKLMPLRHSIENMKEKTAQQQSRKLFCEQEFYFCLNTLMLDEPNLKMAYESRKNISCLARGNWCQKKLHAAAPEGRAFYGLVATTLVMLLVVTVVNIVMVDGTPQFIKQKNDLMTVILAGGLGSIVSILVRLQDFSKMSDTSVLFFTGCVRPLIGIGFAIFLYGLINAGMLPIKLEGKEHYIYLSISFLAGFSERLGTSVASRSEAVLVK
ncbi:hypothetical protein ACTJKN_07185 [Pedobacter sp. 22163]|uniref:hypothetical protein n=1 Tax=Pedobacter sp. 22163 TaxID=3453883 RepID=UPI003F837424